MEETDRHFLLKKIKAPSTDTTWMTANIQRHILKRQGFHQRLTTLWKLDRNRVMRGIRKVQASYATSTLTQASGRSSSCYSAARELIHYRAKASNISIPKLGHLTIRRSFLTPSTNIWLPLPAHYLPFTEVKWQPLFQQQNQLHCQENWDVAGSSSLTLRSALHLAWTAFPTKSWKKCLRTKHPHACVTYWTLLFYLV